MSYRAKADVQSYSGTSIPVSERAYIFDPEKMPGIVVSRSILQKLGGAEYGGSGNSAAIAKGLQVLPLGTLGLVRSPQNPAGTAAPFSEGGPPYSGGEITNYTAGQARIRQGSGFFATTQEDKSGPPRVGYDFVLGTAPKGSISIRQLEPGPVTERLNDGLRQLLIQRADQLLRLYQNGSR